MRSTCSVAIGPAEVSTPTTRRTPADAVAVSSPVNSVRSRSSTPAAAIAIEYARTFRGGSMQPSVVA